MLTHSLSLGPYQKRIFYDHSSFFHRNFVNTLAFRLDYSYPPIPRLYFFSIRFLLSFLPFSWSAVVIGNRVHRGSRQPRIQTQELGHSLVRSLAPLTHLLALHCLLCEPVHSSTRLLIYSLPSLRESKSLNGCSCCFFLVLNHSGVSRSLASFIREQILGGS